MLKVQFRKNIVWVLGVMCIIAYMFPYFFLGEDAFITIHDFLDSNVVHQKQVIELGLIGNPDGELNILNGVPSMTYIPLIPIDVKNILYLIFPVYWAIVINTLFVKFVAFTGMYMLCKRYITPGKDICKFIVALLFMLVPFYVDYGISSAGVPLFLYCFLNLENRRDLLVSFILIVFFVCNSSLTLIGFFICFLWSGWIVYCWLRKKNTVKLHIIGLMLMILVYMFVNVSIIYNYFFSTGELSHRVEFVHDVTFFSDLKKYLMYLFYSQYHAGRFCAILIILFVVIEFSLNWERDSIVRRLSVVYVLIIFLMLAGLIMKSLPIQLFKSFQFDRFYFLYPSLCFILLAKALSLVKQRWFQIVLPISFVVVLVSTLSYDSEYIGNLKTIMGKDNSNPSFRQFFDTRLFEEIKNQLNLKTPFSSKVVCVGMYPSVAEYNEFYTLDSYVFSYSLDYKHKFRKVIAGELEKDESLRKNFDNWGSRCYVFSSELKEKGNQYLCSKKDGIIIENLDINTRILKDMGCQYVFSAVDIKNYKKLNLEYVNSYTRDNSYWNIRVYKLL
jgi:hypothetical protein